MEIAVCLAVYRSHRASILILTKGVLIHHNHAIFTISPKEFCETCLVHQLIAWEGHENDAQNTQGDNSKWILCRKVRVFWFAKAKLRRVYDESSEATEELQRSEGGLLKVEAMDFGRRMATERALDADPEIAKPNAVFDISGNFLLYPTMLGIKVGISDHHFEFLCFWKCYRDVQHIAQKSFSLSVTHFDRYLTNA